jgi:hypothetical protein
VSVDDKGGFVHLRNLDDTTRTAMLSEVDRDIAAGPGPTGVLYLSPRLSTQGISDYPELLRDAVQSGNDATLADALASHGDCGRTKRPSTPRADLTSSRPSP